MVQLKGGFETQDPRLDRIPQFDPRNLEHTSRRRTAVEIKENYWDVRGNLDQGFEGACVGFGFAHNALSRPKANGWVNEKDARSLYHEAQRLDEWDGGSYEGADPFYEGTSVLAGAKAALKKGFFEEYRWTTDVMEMAAVISNDGPIVIGVDWYEGMDNTSWTGYIYPDGYILGGHCVLVYGVNPINNYFTIWNSWGTSWGVNGTAKISFQGMAFLLANNGEACIPVRRGYVIDPHER